MVATLLEMHGCDVRTAFDGQQAVQEAERFRPELILLDVTRDGRGEAVTGLVMMLIGENSPIGSGWSRRKVPPASAAESPPGSRCLKGLAPS